MPSSRRSIEAWFYRAWQGRGVALLLLPLGLLFLLLTLLRRWFYALHIFSSWRLRVPVVVVGNITVGGAGKTPLILYLAQHLVAQGRRPGIVSRGYGADLKKPQEVFGDSTASDVGDEALLLKRRSNVPMFVGCDRARAGTALLEQHPQCDVILCDDGLQHYALQRDIEIAVFDRRGVMNGWPLPAGPLRELPYRLNRVDAVVTSEINSLLPGAAPVFRMRLAGERFYRLGAPGETCRAADLRPLRLHAVAGIGAPQRFFEHLLDLGLIVETHAFADHHRYIAGDLAFTGDAILMTEKDAVKCAGLSSLPVWVLPVDAVVEPDLAAFVLEKLDGPPPA